jgi:hypothetical protein
MKKTAPARTALGEIEKMRSIATKTCSANAIEIGSRRRACEEDRKGENARAVPAGIVQAIDAVGELRVSRINFPRFQRRVAERPLISVAP